MILDFLDSLYAWISQKNFYWRLFRYFVKVLANIYVSYFMPIKNRGGHVVDENSIIVSLTSFHARISCVWKTIACLLNQNESNIHIILWLSKLQFSKKENLPRKLLKLQKKGLEIKFVDDDLRPHKKYYYALQSFPKNDLVTVDDDVLYCSTLIERLTELGKLHKNCVACNRSAFISRESYRKWASNRTMFGIESNVLMPTGVGGVLYPAGIFDNTRILDKDIIKATCLNADDLWLSFWTRFGKHKVVQTSANMGFISVMSSQKNALFLSNVDENRNDSQIKAINNWASECLKTDFWVETGL